MFGCKIIPSEHSLLVYSSPSVRGRKSLVNKFLSNSPYHLSVILHHTQVTDVNEVGHISGKKVQCARISALELL